MRQRQRPTKVRRLLVGPARPKFVSKIRRTKVQAYTEEWDSISASVIRRDNYRCVECGSKKRLQAHHVIPVSKGGLTVRWNLRTLCEACHCKKHKHLN